MLDPGVRFALVVALARAKLQAAVQSPATEHPPQRQRTVQARVRPWHLSGRDFGALGDPFGRDRRLRRRLRNWRDPASARSLEGGVNTLERHHAKRETN